MTNFDGMLNGVVTVWWSNPYMGDHVLVSELLERWLDADYRTQVAAERIMEPVVQKADENGWSAIGFLALAGGDPWHAGREVEHHGLPRYGNAHLCELARGEAEQERVTYALQQAQDRDCPTDPLNGTQVSRETWIIDNGVLFYDVGAQYTAEAVARLESDLSESALHDEDRVRELEEQAAEEGFRLPVVEGAEPDEHEVFRTYVRMNGGSLCPECGIEYDEMDALREHYGHDLVDCFDCNDLVLWDGYGERPQCCPFCERERANASVSSEQEDVEPSRWEFDRNTGNGMVIRFGELYWVWNTVAQVWDHVPHRWREAVNR